MLRYQSSEICRNLEIWQGTSVDVGSAQGSVKDSAEPGGEEDNISKSDQKNIFYGRVRNECRLATETGRLRGETSTFVPELNLKIWNWENFIFNVFAKSVLHTLNSTVWKLRYNTPDRNGWWDWKIY